MLSSPASMPPAKKRSRKRRRPGRPRKSPNLARITLRISATLADRMIAACAEQEITQREFVEQAVQDYCKRPISQDGLVEQEIVGYRTGMWIDPAVVNLMDAREVEEGIRQRALLERAIGLRLQAKLA